MTVCQILQKGICKQSEPQDPEDNVMTKLYGLLLFSKNQIETNVSYLIINSNATCSLTLFYVVDMALFFSGASAPSLEFQPNVTTKQVHFTQSANSIIITNLYPIYASTHYHLHILFLSVFSYNLRQTIHCRNNPAELQCFEFGCSEAMVMFIIMCSQDSIAIIYRVAIM